MFSTNGTILDITVEGLRFLAYLLLLIGAVIGIFSNMSMIQEKYRSVWYRCRNTLVYMGLGVGIIQGITSMINIMIHQGWSAAIIPFTTASGRLANGCALIAFYITLAYVIPAILLWQHRNHHPSQRFISVLLYPVLELLLLSGLLTRNDSGILSIHLFYVFTGLCLIWLFVLQFMSGESKRRRERKHWWVSPDIKVGHQSSTDAKQESKQDSSLFHSKGF